MRVTQDRWMSDLDGASRRGSARVAKESEHHMPKEVVRVLKEVVRVPKLVKVGKEHALMPKELLRVPKYMPKMQVPKVV